MSSKTPETHGFRERGEVWDLLDAYLNDEGPGANASFIKELVTWKNTALEAAKKEARIDEVEMALKLEGMTVLGGVPLLTAGFEGFNKTIDPKFLRERLATLSHPNQPKES